MVILGDRGDGRTRRRRRCTQIPTVVIIIIIDDDHGFAGRMDDVGHSRKMNVVVRRRVMGWCQGFLPRETLLVRRRSLLVVLLQGRDQVGNTFHLVRTLLVSAGIRR